MKNYAKVGVAILTYNSGNHIKRCLSSLTKNTYPNYHIVIIDNASSDNTVFLIRRFFPHIKVICNEHNLGYAKGNNLGIRYLMEKLHCDYILLLNSDTVVADSIISQLLLPFSNNPDIGITGAIVTYFAKPSHIWFAGGYFNRFSCYTRHQYMNHHINTYKFKDHITDYISGCCMMVKKELFTKIGLLDESYEMYFEDVAFCLAAKQNNYFSFLIAKPLVKHIVSASSGKKGSNQLTSLRAYFYARNPFIYIKKNSHGQYKLTNILGQFAIRFPYYMMQMINTKDWLPIKEYFHGLFDGLLYLFNKG